MPLLICIAGLFLTHAQHMLYRRNSGSAGPAGLLPGVITPQRNSEVNQRHDPVDNRCARRTVSQCPVDVARDQIVVLFNDRRCVQPLQLLSALTTELNRQRK